MSRVPGRLDFASSSSRGYRLQHNRTESTAAFRTVELHSGLSREMRDGDEPPGASRKHNKRERLISVRSSGFCGRHATSNSPDSHDFDAITVLPHQNLCSGVCFDELKSRLTQHERGKTAAARAYSCRSASSDCRRPGGRALESTGSGSVNHPPLM